MMSIQDNIVYYTQNEEHNILSNYDPNSLIVFKIYIRSFSC